MIRVLLSLFVMALLAACQQMPVNNQAVNPAHPAAAASAPAPSRTVSTIVEFRLAQSQPARNLTALHIGKQTLYFFPPPVLTGNDLARAIPMKTSQGQPFVRLEFNQAGAQRLAALTRQNAGRWLLITVNGKLVAAPRIGGPMTQGIMNMTTDSDRNAVLVANDMNGAVPGR